MGAIGHKGKHSAKGEGIIFFVFAIFPSVIISPMIVNSPIIEEKYVVIMTNHPNEGCHLEDL
jgi:hypothetical protein